jgi:hypothetical protein
MVPFDLDVEAKAELVEEVLTEEAEAEAAPKEQLEAKDDEQHQKGDIHH